MSSPIYLENPIKVPRFEESAGYYTTKRRRKIMAKIKGKDSKPELRLRKALYQLGYRYRLHVKELPGKPDIVFKRYKLVIFVDGEFWHGFNWENTKNQVKSNRGFWIPKIERNMQKDYQVNKALRDLGYVVFRFWSSDILKRLPIVLNQIQLFLETRKEYK